MRQQALFQQLRKKIAVSCRGINCVKCGQGRCPMVGVADINVLEPKIGRIHGQNDIGAVLTKHANEDFPEFAIILQLTVL